MRENSSSTNIRLLLKSHYHVVIQIEKSASHLPFCLHSPANSLASPFHLKVYHTGFLQADSQANNSAPLIPPILVQ